MNTQLRNGRTSILKSSIFLFVIRFFPAAATLAILLYYSRILPQAAYGRYQHFWTQYYIFSAIAVAGIPTFIITYTPRQMIAWLKSWAVKGWLLFAAWVLALSAVFGVLQWWRGGLTLWIAPAFLLLATAYSILEALLLLHRRFLSPAVLSALYFLFFFALHVFAARHGKDFSWLFGMICICMTVRLALLAAFDFKTIKAWRRVADQQDKAFQREAKNLWLHLGAFDALQFLFRWLDKFIIALWLPASAFAVYFNGSQEIPFLPLFIGVAGSAVLMHISGPGDATALSRKIFLSRQKGRVLSSLVFPVFGFLLFYGPDLLIRLLGERYAPAIPVFLVTLFVVPLRAYNFITLLQHFKKGRQINTGAVLDLVVALTLSYPFYQLWGLTGFAGAFVISSYFQAAYYAWQTMTVTGASLNILLPLGSWLLKMVIVLGLMVIFFYGGMRCGSGNAALVLGIAVSLAATILFLLADLEYIRKHGYEEKA